MKKTRQRLFGLLLAVLIAFSFTSCDFFAELLAASLFSYSGSVVDSRATGDVGVQGVEITLTALVANDAGNFPEYTVTTNSSGDFTIFEIESGEYALTAEKSGWFIPEQKVSVSGLMADSSPLPAFELLPADAYGLSFIVTWNDAVNDVDTYFSYPTSPWTAGDMETPYDYFGTSGRGMIKFSNKSSDGLTLDDNTAVYMDRDDVNGEGPETVTLRFCPTDYVGTPPTGSSAYATTVAADENGLFTAFGDSIPSTATFQWIGSCELYLDAFTTDANLSSGTANSAEARVYAIQTLPVDEDNFDFDNLSSYSSADMTSKYLGYYEVPGQTVIKDASILRVNMFDVADGSVYYEAYQVVPDIQVYPAGKDSFRDISLSNPVVGVKGRQR